MTILEETKFLPSGDRETTPATGISQIQKLIRHPVTKIYKFTVRMLGDSGVGKTCLLNTLKTKELDQRIPRSISVHIGFFHMRIGGDIVTLQLWDTTGGRHFGPLYANQLRSSHAVIIVYSLDPTYNSNILESVEFYNKTADKVGGPGICKFLVCNKTRHSEELTKFTTADGQNLADRLGLKFYETAADDFCKVKAVFAAVGEEILLKVKTNQLEYERRWYDYERGVEMLETPTQNSVKADLENDGNFEQKYIQLIIFRTLDKDDEDIKRRVKILTSIMNKNPVILKTYQQFNPKSPLLEEKVHVDLLIHLMEQGVDCQLTLPNNDNLISVAVCSNMNESQMQSLCFYVINKRKAYDLFSKKINSWDSPVFIMLQNENQFYLESLKLIFDIPRFDINQTINMTLGNSETFDLSLFQQANMRRNRGKCVDLFKLMIEKGADYKLMFPKNRTPLMIAAKCNDLPSVEYFISLGFSIHDRDSQGFTPLCIAFSSCHLKMIGYLIAKGADISVKTSEGFNVLHLSAQNGKAKDFEKIVKYFLRYSPKIFKEMLINKTKCGDTALDIRRKRHPGDRKGIRLLKQLMKLEFPDGTFWKRRWAMGIICLFIFAALLTFLNY